MYLIYSSYRSLVQYFVAERFRNAELFFISFLLFTCCVTHFTTNLVF